MSLCSLTSHNSELGFLQCMLSSWAVPPMKKSSYTWQLPEICCSGADSIPDLLLHLWAITDQCLPTFLSQILLFHHPVSHNFHCGNPTTLLRTTIWSYTKAKASKIPLHKSCYTLVTYWKYEQKSSLSVLIDLYNVLILSSLLLDTELEP